VEQVRVTDGGERVAPALGHLGGRIRPALRAVLGCGSGLVAELIAAPPPRLEQLQFACTRYELETLAAGLGRLGTLREVEIVLGGQSGMAADAGLGAVTTLIRHHSARLAWLRLPLVSVLPGEVQAMLGRYAPKAEVELVYHDGLGGQGWVRVTAAEASLHVKGRVPEGAVQAMGAQLWRSGVVEVDLHDEGERRHRRIRLR
jgi:hypothetical protein